MEEPKEGEKVCTICNTEDLINCGNRNNSHFVYVVKYTSPRVNLSATHSPIPLSNLNLYASTIAVLITTKIITIPIKLCVNGVVCWIVCKSCVIFSTSLI